MGRTYFVLGRGIAGLAVAFEILKKNLPVTVIGPAGGVGAATSAAVGLSSLKGQFHASMPLFKAKVEGHLFLWPWLSSIEEASSLQIPKFRALSYEPYWSLTEYERIRERVFHRAFSGHTGAEFAEPRPTLADLFTEPPTGTAVYEGDLWFDPRVCLSALERAIENLGGRFIEDRIRGISGVREQLCLQGEKDSYKSEHLILAAGVHSDALLQASGIPAPKQRGVYGETLVIDKFSLGSPQIVHMGQKHLVLWNGTICYGSSSYDLDADLDSIPKDPKAMLAMDSRLKAAGAYNNFSTRYTGIRGRYKDIAPCIGEINVPQCGQKLILFSGFYKSGLQLAPLFARKLASYISASSAFLCEPQFSVSRFSSQI